VSDTHRVVPSPTTRLVLSNMIGAPQPEATIYVEDNFAAALVSRCLPKETRNRIRVVPVGDKFRVAGQLGAHNRGQMTGPAKCVFDGDCKDSEINRWMRSEGLTENQSEYIRLPGDGLPPERWVARELQSEPYLSRFSALIECGREETAEELRRLSALSDHHDVPFELARRTGLSEEEAVFALVSAIASTHRDLEDIRVLSRNMLI